MTLGAVVFKQLLAAAGVSNELQRIMEFGHNFGAVAVLILKDRLGAARTGGVAVLHQPRACDDLNACGFDLPFFQRGQQDGDAIALWSKAATTCVRASGP